MKKNHLLLIIAFVCLALLVVACSGPKPPKKVIVIQQPVQGQAPQAQATQAGRTIPNPASENCVKKGGTLTIVKGGDGGEYGVCTFTDNMQCEEWALFRGDCPVGGIKDHRLCDPCGGLLRYHSRRIHMSPVRAIPSKNRAPAPSRTARVCDVWDLWNGKCSSNSSSPISCITDRDSQALLTDGHEPALLQ